MFQVLLMSCADALQIKCNVLYMCVRAVLGELHPVPWVWIHLEMYLTCLYAFSSYLLTSFSEDVDF
jgi:hypothetical protein